MKIADQLRKMGFSDGQIATALVDGKPIGQAEAPEKKKDNGWKGFKSKWESLYASHLETLLASGEIVAWQYEPITFNLSEAAIVDGQKVRALKYTPDFVLWLPDGRRRCIEIKGKWRQTKDINRFKIAKDKFRHEEFWMLKYTAGVWERLPY